MITSQLNPLQGGFYLISLQCDLFVAKLSTEYNLLVKLKSLHGGFWLLNSLHEDLFVAELLQSELFVAELSTGYMTCL